MLAEKDWAGIALGALGWKERGGHGGTRVGGGVEWGRRKEAVQIAKWGFQASLTGSKTFKASSKERGQKHLEPPLLCVDGGQTSLHCKLTLSISHPEGEKTF